MRKNVAGQNISAQLNSKTTGDAVTSGTTTVYVTGDGGTQGAGSGTVTHEGQGTWNYAPTQAETNYNHVVFTFTNSAAVSQLAQTYPVSYDPTDAAGLGLSRLDAAVTTRASQTSVDTIDDFLDTEVAAIKAKTDNLPADPADASDIAGSFSTVNSTLTTIGGYLDTEIAAIKAKTDNLPAAPAAVGDIPTATQNADALLNRDMSAVSDTNSRSPLNALRFLRNKWGVAASTLTVTKEDDATAAWTGTVTTDAGADPITGNDPS